MKKIYKQPEVIRTQVSSSFSLLTGSNPNAGVDPTKTVDPVSVETKIRNSQDESWNALW